MNRSMIRAFVVSTAFAMMSLVSSAAHADDPGTCKCNNGCHAFPGQCTKNNGCNPGYAPTCGSRADTCPQTGWVSCSGECTCTPIPGWDGGVQDGGIEVDASLPPPPADAGCDCPEGTICVGPENYCAGPCGFGEFICPTGSVCVEGYCVPRCLVFPCTPPELCDLSTGECTLAPTPTDGGAITVPTDPSPDAGTPNPPAEDDSGCGCRSTAAAYDATGLGFGVAALLGLAVAARRRRR